jgi:hypothetical protein
MMSSMSVSFLFPPEDDQTIFDVSDALAKPESQSVPKPKRNTKAIGDQSELEVAVALARAGYLVSKPLGDSHRYDLIIDDGSRLYRVQVKTGRLRGGSVRAACYSSHAHRGGTMRSYRGEVDFIGVFCPETGDVYLVPESEIVDSKMHLRVAPTINRQDKHIRWASRFKLA